MAASNKTTINRVTDDHFDKDKALEAALQQIQKQYGKGAIMKLGESGGLNIETISTGSVSLDIATGVSGIPRGRITEIYGPESSGKDDAGSSYRSGSAENRRQSRIYRRRTRSGSGICCKSRRRWVNSWWLSRIPVSRD